MAPNTVLPTLAEHLKEPCAHVVQQERVREKLRWFRPPGDCFQKTGAGFVLRERLQKIGAGLVPQDSVSKNADGPDLPVIFHDPQTQQRQNSPCSHSPQRGG